MQQARYWLLTIPHNNFLPYLPNELIYIKGQLEEGNNTGYKHWQIVAHFKRKTRLAGVKKVFGMGIHAEPTRSEAAEAYVFKQDTKIQGTEFELGQRFTRRNDKEYWKDVKEKAQQNRLEELDGDVYVKYYNTLKRIAKDHMQKPTDLDDVCGIWIWGPPGVGKSRKARLDYPNAYFKMCNKWWDGYQNEESIIIDDLDKNHKVLGHHLKIWSDRYSFIAEAKGGAICIRPKHIVVTSNYKIEEIFEDEALIEALKRRFTIIQCPIRLY